MDKVEEKLVRIDERLLNIEQELRIFRTDLDILRTKVENIEGYRLEIDHALERIAVIEKHLGIRSKLAA
ncbi:hypothetical protein [Bradyrhizobium australafricanum]|uniref:hypothetical protein n=1 Tax=Bradyrhizobium australafricanum TaxID=2821406 RepID=UPI001CE34C9E|nr:hypothetical protein [Bradyrhizobium australafricanum]MCA6105304.1 hypothetical protein [Bradyrhizobium australafricanum]